MAVDNVDAFISNDLSKLLVPISRLNRGEANKVIDELKEDGVKVVCKNNKPECVMLSYSKYVDMVNALKKVGV